MTGNILTLQGEVDNTALAVQDTDLRLQWFEENILSRFTEQEQAIILAEMNLLRENMAYMRDIIIALNVARQEAEFQRDGAIFDADYYRQNSIHVVAGGMGETMNLSHQDAVRLLEAMSGIGGTYISQYTMKDFCKTAHQLTNELLEEEIFLSAEGKPDDEY